MESSTLSIGVAFILIGVLNYLMPQSIMVAVINWIIAGAAAIVIGLLVGRKPKAAA